MRAIFIVLLLSVVSAASSHAEDRELVTEYSLNRLRLSQETLYSKGQGVIFTGVAAWAPTLFLSYRWAIVGTAGLSVLKAGDESMFAATELTLALQYAFTNKFLLEVGGGAESWLNRLGNIPLATGRIVSPMRIPEIDTPIQLVVGYSALFVPNHLTHQLQLGLGLQI